MKKIVSLLFALGTAVLVYGCGSVEFEQKSDEIILELGEDVSEKAEDYVTSSSKRVLENAEVETYKVDNMTAGEYEVYITYKEQYLVVPVVVKDTISPQVTLKSDGSYEVVPGYSISSEDMIESAEDLAGIGEVAFAENQVDEEVKPEDADDEDEADVPVTSAVIPTAHLFYEEPGAYENELIVTDNSGNETRLAISVLVGGDYDSEISGFHDFTTKQGEKPDWMEGIEYTERIKSVETDDSEVQLNTPGEYTLTYIITGDDGVTVLKETVKVTVEEKEEEPVTETPTTSNRNNNSNNNTNTTKKKDTTPKQPKQPAQPTPPAPDPEPAPNVITGEQIEPD